jgi:hypothetical protein
MKRVMVASALGLSLFAAAGSSAQSVAGTYSIEYSARMMVNDQPSPTETITKVKLVLEQKGDSVRGSWQMVSPREAPVQQLKGTVQGNTVRLFGSASAMMRGAGDDRQVTMTQEYVITIDGEAVKGYITVHPPEGIMINGAERHFTGTRNKNES